MGDEDVFWMEQAFEQARQAELSGEVPVGAVLVYEGQMIACGQNASITRCDPSAHAEINVLRAAGQQLNNYRFPGATLYVTLEPCPMCAGAIVHARIQRLVFAASDPRTGAAGSVFNLVRSTYLNHQVEVVSGVLAQRSAEMLRAFFQKRR